MNHDIPSDPGVISGVRFSSSLESEIFRRTIALYKAHPDAEAGVVKQTIWCECARRARDELEERG